MRCGSVVVYLLAEAAENAGPSKVGLVVGKAVGGSVTRHRVSRRLRAQLADRLDRIPNGARVVVRALPDSSNASSAALGRDLSRALAKLTAPAGHPTAAHGGDLALTSGGRGGSSR